MANLIRTLAGAFRSLRRRPGSSFVAVLTLALGIGANTTIFSLLNAIVLRPLPVPHPEELVGVSTAIADDVNGNQPLSLAMFEEIARGEFGIVDVFAWNAGGVSNFEAQRRRFAADLASVSGGYYKAMRIAPLLGRFIEPSDLSLHSGVSNTVAVISYRAWRGWFHSDPHIIGSVLHVEKQPFTVIGVEPEGFSGMIIDGSADVTIPVLSTGQSRQRDLRSPQLLWLTVYGRLSRGLTLKQARARLQAAWPHIQNATMPPGYEGARKERFFARKIVIESAASGVSFLRKRFEYPLRILLALVGAVLLIACLNLANLTLARDAARHHETAVRAALGASAWELASQPLFESLILSAAGAAVGIGFAYWLGGVLLRLAWNGLFPSALSNAPDVRVLLFTAATALATGVVFALAPIWIATRADPVRALKNNSRSIQTGASSLSRVLLVLQVALSVVMVVGALLFAETLRRFHSVDPGYDRDHLLTMLLSPQAGNTRDNKSAAYFRELAAALRRLPGVVSVSFSGMAPADEYEDFSPVYASRTQPAVQAIGDFVSPDFFSTAGVDLVQGREFDWRDDDDKRELVILTQSLSERLFGHANPVGRNISLFPVSYGKEATVIGVVKSASLWKIESHRPMAFFQPFTKIWSGADPLVDIRTSGNPQSIKAAAEQVVRSFGRHYSLQTLTVNERLDTYITAQRLTAMLTAFFGSTAVLIASIGLYGLLSFQVAGRVPELGIRIALGAQSGQIVGLVIRDALILAGTGCLGGVLASLAGGRVIQTLLFGVSAFNPRVLLAACGVLLAVALLAAWAPARRAASTEPMVALRGE
jgi:putative ABC transport system permease protein